MVTGGGSRPIPHGFMKALMNFITDDARRGGMASEETVDETTVNDRYAVTIPSAIRNRLDIEPGDKVRWSVTEDGSLDVEITRQRYGAFDDFEPVDMGATHAAEEHDRFGLERRDR